MQMILHHGRRQQVKESLRLVERQTRMVVARAQRNFRTRLQIDARLECVDAVPAEARPIRCAELRLRTV